MILGVGLDICQVSRMAEAINHPRFLNRVFSETERAYLQEKGAHRMRSEKGFTWSVVLRILNNVNTPDWIQGI